MVIPTSGTFCYEALLDTKELDSPQPVLSARDCRGGPPDSLVGPAPRVVLNGDRTALVATGRDHASLWMVSFATGDVVWRFGRDRDTLFVGREGTGDLGMSLFRSGELVLAVGDLSAVPTGSINVRCGPQPRGLEPRAWREFDEAARADRWVEFITTDARCDLRRGEASRLGAFDVYLERCWSPGAPGTGLCAAIARTEIPQLRDAAVCAAALIGYADIEMRGWECISEG